jgi:hypothetical protein
MQRHILAALAFVLEIFERGEELSAQNAEVGGHGYSSPYCWSIQRANRSHEPDKLLPPPPPAAMGPSVKLPAW